MRSDVRVLAVAVVALISLAGQTRSAARTTTWSPASFDEDLDVVEELFCDDVVSTERLHVPAFTDQHHQLLQLHVRSNLQVTTAYQYLQDLVGF